MFIKIFGRKKKGDILDSLLALLLSYREVTDDNWPKYKTILELVLWVSAALDMGKKKTDAASYLYALEVAEKRMPPDMPELWHNELVTDMRDQWAASLGIT